MNNICLWILLIICVLPSCLERSQNDKQNDKVLESDSLRVEHLLYLGDSVYAQRKNLESISTALIYFDSALHIVERSRDTLMKAMCYLRLGSVYIAWNKEPLKTIEYYKKSLGYLSTLPRKRVLSYYIQYILAHAYSKEKAKDSINCIATLRHTAEQLEYEPDSILRRLDFISDYAWVASNNGNYEFAENFLKKFVKRQYVVNDIETNNYLDHYYLTRARVDILGKKLSNSVYLDSIEFAIQNCNNQMDKRYYLECISKLYHVMRDYKSEAATFHRIATIETLSNEISILKNKNDLEKNLNVMTLQKLELEAQTQRTRLGLFLLIGILIFILGLWRYRAIKLHKTQLEEDARRQTIFTQKLLEVTELERKRIASELHDSVSNDLVALKQFLKNESLDLNSKIEKILSEVRMISRNLHPTFFERVGLKYSILQLIERIQNQDNFMLSAEIDYKGYFNSIQELQLYRIIQEAITNMVKYSGAIAGKISILESENEVDIEIIDNGNGFDVEQKINSNDSFGLHNIIERSKAIGGNTTIISGKEGTSIRIKVLKNQK